MTGGLIAPANHRNKPAREAVEADASLALATVADNPERKKVFGFKWSRTFGGWLQRPPRSKQALAAVIDSIRRGVQGLDEIAQLGRTLWRRRHDILAFFDHHASNGPTEAINGRLEALRRNALGFRNLTAAADHLLPWAHQLGSPETGHQRPRTAIERADHHLDTAASSPEHHTARQLLQRRDQLLDHFRELADIAAQFDAAATRSHERSHSNDYGLEL